MLGPGPRRRLVGYQLDRAIARARQGWAGPTAAPSPTRRCHVPIQRMANVSLQPAAADGPTTDELIARVERRHLHRRRQELVDRHAALQLPVHRAAVLPHRATAGWPASCATSPTRRPPPTSGGRWRRSAARRPTCWAARSTAARRSPGRSPRSATAARRRCSAGSGCSTRAPRPASERPPGTPGSHGRRAAPRRGGRGPGARRRRQATRAWSSWRMPSTPRSASPTTRLTTNGVRAGSPGHRRLLPPGAVGAVDRRGTPGWRRRRRGARRGRRAAARPRVAAADDASPLVDGRARDPATSPSRPGDRPLGARLGARRAVRGVRPGPRADRVLPGSRSTRWTTVYLGSSTGLRRRHVQPTGALDLVASGRRAAPPRGRAWAPPDSPTSTSKPSKAACSTARLGEAKGRPPGRALRGPASARGGRRPDGRPRRRPAVGRPRRADGVLRPGGGTRVGETFSRAPLDLRSDPAEPGLECAPFLVADASGPDVSVFDNGLPLGRDRLDRGRSPRRPRYHRAGAARSGAPVAPPVDNLVLELPGGGAAWRTWSPGPIGACC